ncbi:MAG: type II secretion system protein GspE [Elusimicrobia bacterium CG08_land_8_20_14_0_20_59_10]|nr:MAG: type II secretion system protein GspE [Elusimicrobia bacterium CG08_land_8_20_14_0_20_59_10]
MAKKLGEIMIQSGWIDEEKLNKGLKFQQQQGCLIGEALVKLHYVNEEQVGQALGKQLGIPYASRENQILNPEKGQGLEKIIPEKFARENAVIPLFVENGVLAVAVTDPTNIMMLDNVKLVCGSEIQLFISTKAQILKVIDSFYQGQTNLIDRVIEGGAGGGKGDASESDAITPDGKLDLDKVIIGDSKGAQSIKLVNAIMKQAISERTSDIHLEKFDEKVSLRLRIDGVLYERSAPPAELVDAMISRVKILSKLDISERRLPQDGSFSIKYQNRIIEIRVSVCPTVFGEKLVMRILDRGSVELNVKVIGFEQRQMEDFLKAASAPNGLIFLTGPTGSGKTTTLNAVLNTIKSPELNIMTLEDPVEIKMEGISQVQVKPAIGLTMASGLRSFLRQDPDVILVGEVRDNETAEACLKAAMTGHLVLSTLHTNSALEAIPRLLDMAIERYLLASTLLCLAAQRLVRQLCPECKQAYRPPQDEIDQFVAECMLDPMPDTSRLTFYRAKGCPKCNNMGYKGRKAIYEVYFNTEAMKRIIYKDADVQKIAVEAAKGGAWNLRASGWRKVMAGVTSVEDMLSVTVSER